MAKAHRRKAEAGNVPVGLGAGIMVWLDPDRPGLHFRVHDAAAPFVITGTWQMREQGLVLVEIGVRSEHPITWTPESLEDLAHAPAGPPGPPPHISGSALRSVSVPELERRTRAAIKHLASIQANVERATEEARKQGFDIPALYRVPTPARDVFRKLGKESFRPGRQGYPIGLYAWIAREYLRLARGRSRGILPELAERASIRLNRPVSVANVRDWVHRARELKMLSPGIQGKAHAEPGPALRGELR